MAVRTIGCGACGAVVPYGRLSCPECGELLASVAGAVRRPRLVDPETVEAADPELDGAAADGAADDLAKAGFDEAEPVAAPADPDAPPPGAIPDVLHDAGDLTALAPDAWPEPPVDDGVDVLDAAFPPTADGSTFVALEPTPEAAPDPAPPPSFMSEPAPEPAWPADLPDREPTPEPAAPPPGAYVPPAPFATSGAMSAGLAATATLPAGPAAPARVWAGEAAPRSDDDRPATPASSEDDDAREARLTEAIGWIAIAGSAMAAAGFLLPWARTIIGAGGDGYLDRWGLAGPGHPLIVLAILVMMSLVILDSRVPAWLRLGIPGLGLGALLLGLLWPYVFGPLGTQPGALVSMAGALLLIGAGVGTLVIERHEGKSPAV